MTDRRDELVESYISLKLTEDQAKKQAMDLLTAGRIMAECCEWVMLREAAKRLDTLAANMIGDRVIVSGDLMKSLIYPCQPQKVSDQTGENKI